MHLWEVKQDSGTPSGYISDGWQPDLIRHAQPNDPEIVLLLATLDITRIYFSIACYTIYFLFLLNYVE